MFSVMSHRLNKRDSTQPNKYVHLKQRNTGRRFVHSNVFNATSVVGFTDRSKAAVLLLFDFLWSQDEEVCLEYFGSVTVFFHVSSLISGIVITCLEEGAGCFADRLSEPQHDETNKMTCAPSEDSDQPVCPHSLTGVFLVRMTTTWILSYPLSAQRSLRSDWADAQADLSLSWAHMPIRWFCHEAAHLCIHLFYSSSWYQRLRSLTVVLAEDISTWQNQQNVCAPSEDSDQPGHSPNLIRVFAVRSMGS